MSFKPEGIVVPVVTPVDAEGCFNERAYRDLIEYLAANGIRGVFPFGTTGEFYAFDEGVYRHVLETTRDAVRGRMHIYAGANHITPAGALKLARIAEETGVDALSVLTPMFVSQTQAEVYAYYREVAEGTALPVVVYNNKPKTNVTVEPATIAKLAAIPNVVAVKDSTGDMTNTEEYLRLTRGMENFSVLMGRDTLIYAALCYGAAGAIASCANVAPRIAADIYERFAAGDHKGALEAQFKLAELRVNTNLGTFPVVLKEALAMIGHDCGPCMPPIAPLDDVQREKLRGVLRNIGLLN